MNDGMDGWREKLQMPVNLLWPPQQSYGAADFCNWFASTASQAGWACSSIRLVRKGRQFQLELEPRAPCASPRAGGSASLQSDTCTESGGKNHISKTLPDLQAYHTMQNGIITLMPTRCFA